MEKQEKLRENTNVEFGIEFGDFNNAKFYEYPINHSKEKLNKPNKNSKH